MDFDNAVVEKMNATAKAGGLDIESEAWARQDAYDKAEALKKDLSSLESASSSLTGSGRPLPFDLTRAEFEKLIRNKITATEDTTRYTIEEARLEPSDIDTVLMVGGSSRIPVFQKMLERIFARPPVFSRNLDEDVARGAAMLGAKGGNAVDPRSYLGRIPKPVDVCSKGFGVKALNSERKFQNFVIIPAQSAVPARGKDTFNTVEEGQTQVEIVMNEGDEEDLDDVKEIARGVGNFGQPVPINHPITVKIDVFDGTVVLNAYDGVTDKFMCKLEVERPGLLNAVQRSSARQELARWKMGG